MMMIKGLRPSTLQSRIISFYTKSWFDVQKPRFYKTEAFELGAKPLNFIWLWLIEIDSLSFD